MNNRTYQREYTSQTIVLAGQRIKYRLSNSRSAKKLRVRIGPHGMEVIRPNSRPIGEVKPFLRENEEWIADQYRRVAPLRRVHRSQQKSSQILFRGNETRVLVVDPSKPSRTNRVLFDGKNLRILRGSRSATQPAKSLEYWLRRQARVKIIEHLQMVTRKLKCRQQKVFIRGQRTKWGNCSTLGNLSFNWRMIMAPDYVLRYIVTHEATHLKIPDHSARFWFTVQTLHPRSQEARRWLAVNGRRLHCDLQSLCAK
jgi:predicted metal-dependent hydrolase